MARPQLSVRLGLGLSLGRQFGSLPITLGLAGLGLVTNWLSSLVRSTTVRSPSTSMSRQSPGSIAGSPFVFHVNCSPAVITVHKVSSNNKPGSINRHRLSQSVNNVCPSTNQIHQSHQLGHQLVTGLGQQSSHRPTTILHHILSRHSISIVITIHYLSLVINSYRLVTVHRLLSGVTIVWLGCHFRLGRHCHPRPIHWSLAPSLSPSVSFPSPSGPGLGHHWVTGSWSPRPSGLGSQ